MAGLVIHAIDQNRMHRRADVASDKRICGDVRSGERRDEAIAVARNRRDDIRTNDLAQRGNLHFDVGFLDDKARPDHTQELVLRDNAVTSLDER